MKFQVTYPNGGTNKMWEPIDIVASLKAAKERASTALKNERDRQKRSKAMKSLRSLPTTPL